MLASRRVQLRRRDRSHRLIAGAAQAATGITHVEELVAAFISAEDQNFSMFNYVNELNQEAEKLEEQAAELQGEMERHTGVGASEDSQRQLVVAVR